jgi:hypothetical protein
MRAWIGISLFAVACGSEAGVDAGSLSDAGSIDAGSIDAGPMCTEDIIEPYTGPAPCSQATQQCAAACTTLSCATDCTFDDPNPACGQCWDANQISCWNRNGCQPLWNCVSQCIQEHCIGVPDFDACFAANCQDEDVAYADCFEPVRQMCAERTIACLPEPASADAGVPDGG